MKLQKKKLTNIKVSGEIVPCNEYDCIAVKTDRGVTWYYRSLAELNEEWEDYEEPKEYCYIRGDDSSIGFSPIGNCKVAKRRKEIGNYFETKEEVEKAVEKLKAWKRLKDKGFRTEGWTIDDGLRISICTNMDSDGIYDDDKKEIKNTLDLVFGVKNE